MKDATTDRDPHPATPGQQRKSAAALARALQALRDAEESLREEGDAQGADRSRRAAEEVERISAHRDGGGPAAAQADDGSDKAPSPGGTYAGAGSMDASRDPELRTQLSQQPAGPARSGIGRSRPSNPMGPAATGAVDSSAVTPAVDAADPDSDTGSGRRR